LRAEFGRAGPDLWIETPSGDSFLIPAYFMTETSASLITADGAVLGAGVVAALAGPMAPGQVAQLGLGTTAAQQGVGLGEPIGQVSEAEGEVTVIHPDGTQSTLSTGGQIFQGDVLQTGSASNVSIVFIDDTVFSLDEDGRMVMDEMVYDPDTQTGSFNAQVVQGVFSFVSGQVAKTSPDGMVVNTPTSTIGIRGSTVVGGDNQITLVKDVDGNVGEIIISNAAGSLTLNSAGASTTVFSSTSAPTPVVILSQAEIQQNYGKSLTKLIKVVSKKAQDDAQQAENTAKETQAEAKQAEQDAQKAEADANQAEANAEAAQAEADAAKADADAALAEAEAAKAAAESAGDEEALAKATAAEAKAAEAAQKAAEATAAAEAEAQVATAARAEAAAAQSDAANKGADAEAAQAKAEQAQQFSSLANTAFKAQSQAFEQSQKTEAEKAAKADTADKADTTTTKDETANTDGASDNQRAADDAAAQAAADAAAAAQAAADAAAAQAAADAAAAQAAADAAAAQAAADAAAAETKTAQAETTTTTTPTNAAPVVSSSANAVTISQGAATAVNAGLTLNDSDSTSMSSATVKISGNFESGADVLAFTNTSTITGAWDARAGTMTLTGSDSVANYQAALRSVTFDNTSQGNQSALGRTIDFTVNDGTTDSTAYSSTVSVNIVPVVSSSTNTVTITQGAATAVNAGLTLSDADGTNQSSATVKISGNFESGADVLAFTNTSTITGAWDAQTGTMTLTGSDSVANYQAALRSVTFDNTSQGSQSALGRTIDFTVNDGTTDSTAYSSTVSVNIAPVLSTAKAGSIALKFDGVDDTVSVGNPAALVTGSGSFTWETWVKMDASASTTNLLNIGINDNSATGKSGNLQIDSSGHVMLQIWNASGHPTGSTNVADGTWHHVAVTYDSTAARAVNIYVDGVKETQTLSAATATANFTGSVATLGARNEGTFPLNGEMANVRVWSSVRTAAEVQSDMAGSPTGDTAALLGHWALNDASGSSVVDASGNSHTGTITGQTSGAETWTTAGPEQTVSGPISVAKGTTLSGTVSATDVDNDAITFASNTGPSHGTLVVNADGTYTYAPTTSYTGADSFIISASDGSVTTSQTVDVNVIAAASPPVFTDSGAALDFDGSNDYIDTGLTALSTDFTIEAWFMYDTQGAYIPIASKHTSSGQGNEAVEFNLQIQTNGNLNFFMGNGTGYGVLIDGGVQAVGTWHHVAVSSSSGAVTMYLDGASVSTGTFSGSRISGTQSIEIGHLHNGGDQFFNGQIADVRVWSGARTAAEVSSDMAGSPDDTTGLVAHWKLNDASGASAADSSGNNYTGTITGQTSGAETWVTTSNTTKDTVIKATTGQTYNGSVSATDVNGDTLTYSAGAGPTNGTLVVSTNGTFTYTPNAMYLGSDSFGVSVSDGNDGTDSTTVTVVVAAANYYAGAVTVNFSGTTATVTGSVSETLTNVTSLTGSSGNDIFNLEGVTLNSLTVGAGYDLIYVDSTTKITSLYNAPTDSNWLMSKGTQSNGDMNLSGTSLSGLFFVALNDDHDNGTTQTVNTTTLTVNSSTSFDTQTTIQFGTGTTNGVITSDDGMNLTLSAMTGVDQIISDSSSDTVGATLTLGSQTLPSGLTITGSGDDIIQLGTTSLNLSATTVSGVSAINGTTGNDSITGTTGNDIISGDAGIDTIVGGLGTDTLSGGAGSDLFVYNAATESSVGSGDTISDFDAASADKISITTIVIGSFSWLGAETNAFTGATGGNNTEARFNDTTKLLEIDANGDGTADMGITLTGVTLEALSAADFDYGGAG